MLLRKMAVLGIAAGLLATLAASPANRAAAYNVPFKDANTTGFIGLCDRNGHPVTSGSLDEVPFVWTAVSSTPAPQGYAHGKATLYAYQPRKGVDPSQWGGEQLTASSTFTNPANPMAQATNRDSPLLYFVQTYPPEWDGLVQLRMFFSGVNTPTDVSPYPATLLQVSGNHWTMVSGGTVPCNVGKAVSAETLDLPAQDLATPQTIKVFNSSSAGGFTPTTAQSSPVASQESNSESPTRESSKAAPAGSGARSGGPPAAAIVGIVIGGAGILAGGALGWRRRILARS